jgi:hypothetical protein
MARRTILRQRAWGETILNRLDDCYVPPELTRHVRAFRSAQAGLLTATRKAKTARERRDAALSALARADGALERALVTLGKKLVAAGLGAKKAPFGRASPTPAQIAALDHTREVAEVNRLVNRLGGVRAPGQAKGGIRKALSACGAAATALEKARAAVNATQRIYVRTLDARDALLDKWTTALARLERRAHEVLSEDAEMLAQVFAPLDAGDEPTTVLDLRPPLPNVMNGVHT